LPTEILKRKKIGFYIPAHEWLRGALRSLVIDACTSALLSGEFSGTTVIDTISAPLERKANVGLSPLGLLVLFL